MSTGIRKTRRGVVTVWVALLSVLFFGILGLGLDTGLIALTAHQLQNAADAASLAGAGCLGVGIDEARAAALTVAGANKAAGAAVQLNANGANTPGGDVVVGRYDRHTATFTPTTESPNAVQVTARRTEGSAGGKLSLIFGGIFGVDTVEVERSAVAMSEPAGSAAVIVLDESDSSSLDLNSNARLIVDAEVQVNSSHSRAVTADSNAEIDSTALNIVGDARFSGNSDYVGDDFNAGVPLIPNPLAPLPAPPLGVNRGSIDMSGDERKTVLTPGGYYPGGITLDSNAQLTLAAGIYVLGSPGLKIDSNAHLDAEGVMLYILDGEFLVDSNGDVSLTPPETGPYAGVSVFQARDNTSEAVINSNGTLDLAGTLYFPEAKLSIDSNGDSVGNQIIARKLSMDSNGDIIVNYKAPDAAAALGGGATLFLVE